MSYILVQIVICLAIAGLIGLLFGWLLSKNSFNKKSKKLEDLWRLKVVDVKDEYEQKILLLNEELVKKDIELNNKEKEFERFSSIKNNEIKEFRKKATDRELELKGMIDSREKELDEKNSIITKLQNELDDNKYKENEYSLKLRASDSVIRSVNEKLEALKKKFLTKSERVKELEERLKEVLEELESSKKLQTEKKVLLAKLKASDSIINDIEKKYQGIVKNYEDKISLIAKKLSTIEAQAINNNKEWELKLKSNIKDNEIKRVNLEKTISLLKEELEQKQELEDKLQEYKTKFDELERSLKEERDKKINILKMQLEKQEALNKKMLEELKNYREKVQSLTEEIKNRDEIWKQRIENLLKG